MTTLADPDPAMTFSSGGTAMFAEPMEEVLARSLVTVTLTVAVVLPAKSDEVPVAEHAGAGVPPVAFWTQISKLVTGGGFAPPAGTRRTETRTSRANGTRCRTRTRLVGPSSDVAFLKMLTRLPSYPDRGPTQ
jgi:hypothetical protein